MAQEEQEIGRSEPDTEVRHPEKHSEFIPAFIDREWLLTLSNNGRGTKLLEVLYLICGTEPTVNNIGYHERNSNVVSLSRGIRTAKAIFRGIKRPFIDGKQDEEVYIYILNPSFTYKYTPDMACTYARVPAPRDAVYAVYVRFNADFTQATVLHGDWVEAYPVSSLPVDYKDRYDEEIWNG